MCLLASFCVLCGFAREKDVFTQRHKDRKVSAAAFLIEFRPETI
jgi:hypothetical protein